MKVLIMFALMQHDVQSSEFLNWRLYTYGLYSQHISEGPVPKWSFIFEIDI